jgi:hypothetical protein
MASQRVIRGVLGNFLGTYTSRYTDRDGYWLFGFAVSDLGTLTINLLAPDVNSLSPLLSSTVDLAAMKFQDQLQKAGLVRSQVREASLTIEKSLIPVAGSVNNHHCTGYHVRFLAGVVMEGGKRYERQTIVFAAPHNANIERRSARAN